MTPLLLQLSDYRRACEMGSRLRRLQDVVHRSGCREVHEGVVGDERIGVRVAASQPLWSCESQPRDEYRDTVANRTAKLLQSTRPSFLYKLVLREQNHDESDLDVA
jgi:hypothetical protein